MHLYDRSIGLFGTNGIVGAGIAARRRRGDQRTLPRHGRRRRRLLRRRRDQPRRLPRGAATSPARSRAPVVFVCENNLYATATPLSTRHPQPRDRHQGRRLRHSRRRGRRQRRPRGLAGRCSEAAERARARRRADADRGQDLPHRRPPRGRSASPAPTARRRRSMLWATRDPIATLPQAPASRNSASRAPAPRRHRGAGRRRGAARRSNSPAPRPSPTRRPCCATSMPTRSTRPMRWTPHGARPAGRSRRAGSTRCATASPRRCGASRTSSISARAPASAAAASRTPRASGRSSAPSAWSTRRSASSASPAPRSAPRPPACACIADLMFADFLFEAAGQIVLQAAKLRYMSNGQMTAPMVIRVGCRRACAAPARIISGTYHPVWAHIPGLIVCLPSHAGRRQGPDEDRAARRRPGDHAGAQGAVRQQGPGAGRRAPRAVRRRPHRARRARTSPSRPPASWCTARSRPPTRSRRKASTAR